MCWCGVGCWLGVGVSCALAILRIGLTFPMYKAGKVTIPPLLLSLLRALRRSQGAREHGAWGRQPVLSPATKVNTILESSARIKPANSSRPCLLVLVQLPLPPQANSRFHPRSYEFGCRRVPFHHASLCTPSVGPLNLSMPHSGRQVHHHDDR